MGSASGPTIFGLNFEQVKYILVKNEIKKPHLKTTGEHAHSINLHVRPEYGGQN